MILFLPQSFDALLPHRKFPPLGLDIGQEGLVLILELAGEVQNIGCLNRMDVLQIYLPKYRIEYLVIDLGRAPILFSTHHLGLVQENIFVFL